MDEKDKTQFAQIMYGLADNFRDEISKDGLRFRFEALKKFTIEQIQKASMQIVETRRFTKFPTIADFIHAIEGDPEQNIELKAESQALKVIEAVRLCGSYNPPLFSDKITEHIIFKQYGWGHICSMKEKEKTFFIKDFKAEYSNIAKNGGIVPAIEASGKVLKLTENIGTDKDEKLQVVK